MTTTRLTFSQRLGCLAHACLALAVAVPVALLSNGFGGSTEVEVALKGFGEAFCGRRL